MARSHRFTVRSRPVDYVPCASGARSWLQSPCSHGGVPHRPPAHDLAAAADRPARGRVLRGRAAPGHSVHAARWRRGDGDRVRPRCSRGAERRGGLLGGAGGGADGPARPRRRAGGRPGRGGHEPGPGPGLVRRDRLVTRSRRRLCGHPGRGARAGGGIGHGRGVRDRRLDRRDRPLGAPRRTPHVRAAPRASARGLPAAAVVHGLGPGAARPGRPRGRVRHGGGLGRSARGQHVEARARRIRCSTTRSRSAGCWA